MFHPRACASVSLMGGKLRVQARSSMNLRKVLAPKVVKNTEGDSARREGAEDGVVQVSVHEEVTRDYSINPPTD